MSAASDHPLSAMRSQQSFEIKPTRGTRLWWMQAFGGIVPVLDGPLACNLCLETLLPTLLERAEGEISMQHWHSSKLLAQLVLSVPELVRGKSVLELGAGFHATVALAVSRAGAKTALATDNDDSAIKLCQLNLDAHQRHCVSTGCLDFTRSHKFPFGQFDVLLGADLICDSRLVSPLVAAVRCYLKPGGLMVLLCPKPLCRDGVELLAPQFNASDGLSCTLEPVTLPFARAGNQFVCFLIRAHGNVYFSLDALD